MSSAAKNLKSLIKLYQKEKKQLEKFISEAIEELDYLSAHHYNKKLSLINREIQTLNNIQDPFFDSKKSVKRNIKNLQEVLKSYDTAEMTVYLHERLKEEQKQLENLQQASLENATDSNTDLLERLLYGLVNKEIETLELIMDNERGFSLSFQNRKNGLKVKIENVKNLLKNDVVDNWEISKLINLGFQCNKSQTLLYLAKTGNQNKRVKEMMVVLSKIVFQIFYFKAFQGQSYIRYLKKSSG